MPPKPKRTRTGCLCCRRRHKKCDETKPSCKFCRSKGLQCEWPVKGAVFVNYGNSNTALVTPATIQPAAGAFSEFIVNESLPQPSSGPSSKTTSESSLAPPSPRPRASSISSNYNFALSPRTIETNYNYSAQEQQVSLPPIKPYHFVPRADLSFPLPSKRLSVDSLLN